MRSLAQSVIDGKDAKSIRFMAAWLGVKFRLHGDTKEGIDCVQLLKKFYAMCGLDITLPDDYSCAPMEAPTFFRKEMASGRWKKALMAGRKKHDIVIVNSRHCGLMLTKDIFIDSSLDSRRVALHSLDEFPSDTRFLFVRPA